MLRVDGSTSLAGTELTSLTGSTGDATWPDPEDPAMGVKLSNAGGYTAYVGAACLQEAACLPCSLLRPPPPQLTSLLGCSRCYSCRCNEPPPSCTFDPLSPLY